MTIIDAHNHPDWPGHDLPKFLANIAASSLSRHFQGSCIELEQIA